MAGEIIRCGDPTSHGGHVLEGSLTDICFGKPIALVGHKTYCPKCKGTFPIIEGAQTTTFYGTGVALAGMRTACGAALIPIQFTDTVEYISGSSSPSLQQPGLFVPLPPSAEMITLSTSGLQQSLAAKNSKDAYDLVFRVQESGTGLALGYTRYRITLDDGTTFIGTTDAAGTTEKVGSAHPQNATIEVPFYELDDSLDNIYKHCACDC